MKTRKLVLAALFIALTVALQYTLSPLAQPAVGPVVNMMLVLSALLIDRNYGIVVGFITPVVAMFIGLLPFPILAPLVGIGNAMLILPSYIIKGNHTKHAVAFGIGSILKFVVLAIFANFVFGLVLPKVPPQLVTAFMWPQLLNAGIGVVLALIVYSFIPKKYKGVE